VDPGKKLKGSSPLPQDFHKRLAELAYQPPEFATTGRRKVAIAELTALASVTELSIKTCFNRGRVGGVLLPRKNLVALLSPSAAPLAQASTPAAAADTAAIQLRRALPGSSFRASLLAVRGATAMIRTVRRSGHGFLLSADGYLLTNYRVVSDGLQAMTAPVMVVFADESIPGTAPWATPAHPSTRPTPWWTATTRPALSSTTEARSSHSPPVSWTAPAAGQVSTT